MRYGLRYQGESLEAITDWARKAEAARFDVLWSEELHTSPFVYPAAVAGVTSRIELGSGIALAFVRSPMSMAITALDLDRITGGRYILGLGTGVQRLVTEWHGAAYGKPAPHLNECIQVVRRILDGAHTGRPIVFRGAYYDVNVAGFSVPHPPVRPRIPIYAAAIGAGMVRAVAEVADGILGQIMPSLKWVQDVIVPNMEVGLKRAGRKRQEIDLSPAVAMAIGQDVKQARRDLAKTVAFYCTVATYQGLFAHYGFADEAAAVRDAFRRHGGHGPHCWDLVPGEMVDAFHVAGGPDDARRRVAQYEGIADSVILTPPSYFLTPEDTAHYQHAILETFAR
ncbi:MAG: LLM class flavin-dependent oxidoreductase [Dehalococcoidia bacterium]